MTYTYTYKQLHPDGRDVDDHYYYRRGTIYVHLADCYNPLRQFIGYIGFF